MSFVVDLPDPPDQRVAAHCNRDAVLAVRKGHPWIWRDSIDRVNRDGAIGELAVVFDAKRAFRGIGLWDPTGPIAIRMLHQGDSRSIDHDFFEERLLTSIDRRAALEDDPLTTAWRVVHGENDQLPGLVVDRYESTLVVRLDTLAWLPYLKSVITVATEALHATSVVLRTSRKVQAQLPPQLDDGSTLWGSTPTKPVEFLERGVAFAADVVEGQKTGHFLDQRDNRRLVGERARDVDMLDVFCNSGGFTLHAAMGGARSVHSIDLSPHAIAATRSNWQANRTSLGNSRLTTDVADAFEAMQALIAEGRSFDLVVIDPPSFAPRQSAVGSALRAYRRLTELGAALVRPGGILFQSSCSSRVGETEFADLIIKTLRDEGRRPHSVIRTGHAIDHPIGFAEGSYLKGVLAALV